jgi:prephenate dehydratase
VAPEAGVRLFDAAYQGSPGAYSEEAARAMLGASATLLPQASLEQVFDAVTAERARHAVVPFENTLAGTVPHSYELLLDSRLVAVGETVVHIDHVLAGPPSMRRGDVRRVLSHPVALAQCSDFFRAHREIDAVPAFDTAGAVEQVVRVPDGQTAAIASRRAAELHGASVLETNIQDHRDNWTRFLLLALSDVEGLAPSDLEGSCRALVAFRLAHEPGSLVRALGPLSDRGLNLTRIESRAIRGRPFEYRFIVELTAPSRRRALEPALDALTAATTWLRVLGVFPAVGSGVDRPEAETFHKQT